MKFKYALLSFSLIFSSTAFANPPKPNVFDGGNHWIITDFNDASPTHDQWATQGICFLPYVTVGTQIRGLWYSTTFPDWNGRYAQEGDQLFMYGDYAKDVGHDGMQFELVTTSYRDLAAGHWKEWRENGSYGMTIVFANATLARDGKCNIIQIDDFTSLDIPPRLLIDGRIAENPTDKGQIPLDQLKSK